MTTWFTAALLSLTCFGLWGFFTKLAIIHIDSKSALIYQTVGVLIIGLLTLSQLHFKPAYDVKGMGYGLLTGIAYSVGCLFYFIAADKGKLITVVTMTALYPIVTIILSILLLQETISIKQVIGIILAMVSIVLMSN